MGLGLQAPKIAVRRSQLILCLLAFAVAAIALPILARRQLSPEISALPLYALFSFNRMLLGYILSVIFAVFYGYYAATKPWGEKYLVPILDVLQSIPILGFFPAVLVLCISLSPSQQLGTELAAAFLIFTSMAWNMAYAVYDSAKAIPSELDSAAKTFGLKGPSYFARVIVPAAIPRLVYNSVVSWSVGWFFLVASEIISLGSENHELPGLGSFLVKSAANGDTAATFLGVVTLGIIVASMNTLVWRPLSRWSERFKYDTVPVQNKSVWEKLSRAIPVHVNFSARASAALDWVLEFVEKRDTPEGENRWQRFKKVVYLVLPLTKLLLLIGAGLFLLDIAKMFVSPENGPLPITASEVVTDLVLSFLRLFVAFVLTVAWTLPLGLYLVKNAEAEEVLMPIFEVIMAIPGIAFLPLIVVAVLAMGGSTEIIAVGLLMLAMQGYILFNIISGAKSLPSELEDASRVYGMRGWQYYGKVLLPAMIPAFITGSLTAWGGGWNALIVAEYVVFGNQVISVPGIGSLLNKAIYLGDLRVLIIGVVAMVIPILLINNYVWKGLYRRAARFKVTV